ncbi:MULTISPECIES: universal stress protein [Brevibacterium]|uniref:Usp domain-containing protein n=4 Tax=Brevibacterium TaxID=1696 RepID=K9AXN8_9MICO|nr:universal stress protein [Brevibacterium casei]NNV08754.1 universal stress protein [Geobacillus sp. MMMUD3]SIJ11215.1 UspA domain-containing protein [Mycobacteroides abscessus subsp. abscessus]EKU46285.1 Usp domain-containing protein [Brevibacterium casei S18]KZE22984.1 universal stress protein [Brevibacterium casei]MBE4694815.1 universal stress protein [Brevibacterium casei]
MTILVGYSPSPEGKAAVAFGIEQARAFDDTLIVLNAGIGETPDEHGVATNADMDELKQTLLNSEVSHEILQFLRGNDPVEELLALAEATDDTRMIVIGSRRRSPVGKLIMGSTAQRIILEAEVPVVSVKADRSR